MDARWQKGRLFAAGALVGALLALAIYVLGFDGLDRTPAVGYAPMASPAVVPQAEPSQQQAVAPAACNFEPLVPPRGAGDGQFGLHAALAGHRSGDPQPFLVVAEEAAVQGRPRDAEVALIAACRVAAQAGPTVPLADAQARLAQHYTGVATHEREAAQRGSLMQRAESLLADSAAAFSTALGPNASRTRIAQQRLASFRQGAPAMMSEHASEFPPRPPANPDDTSAIGASRHSLADRPPRSDENLGDVEDDLQRLYHQAQSVSRDPGGVQRRHQQALARRQACRDETCLRQWAAQRKRELFDEF
jgi:hypothetical protein